MRHSFLFQISLLGAGLIVLLAWGTNWQWELPAPLRRVEAPIELSTEPPVLVMLVGDAESVATIRDAVDPDRIVAATPEAFALVEGRIIATSIDAANRPLNRAGWASREIEIVMPPAKLTPGFAQKKSASGPNPSGDSFVALKDKDVLTQGESLGLLKEMNQRGEF